jgi:hypothetical protein
MSSASWSVSWWRMEVTTAYSSACWLGRCRSAVRLIRPLALCQAPQSGAADMQVKGSRVAPSVRVTQGRAAS